MYIVLCINSKVARVATRVAFESRQFKTLAKLISESARQNEERAGDCLIVTGNEFQ